jgi:hypothetical protein
MAEFPKRIELASQSRLAEVESLAPRFFREVLEYEYGDVLVTDESDLRDFADVFGDRDAAVELPELVANRLEGLGIPSRLVDAEVAAMTPVSVARTVDRSVLGILVDFAKMLPYCLDSIGWDAAALGVAQAALERNPCYAGRPFDQVIFPVRTTRQLLESRWGAG